MDDFGSESEWIERIKEFFIVCAHSILHSRTIYPTYTFEQRRYLGITVWQSRHPQVTNYVERVIENANPMFEKNLVDRMIVALETKDSQPLDNIVIKCVRPLSSVTDELTDSMRTILEEEFRSTILRLGMLDQQMVKAPEDCNWKIMIVTSIPTNVEQQQTMQETLTNGQWYVDNNKLPEQSSLSHRARHGAVPRLLPIKSYRDESINMTTYAHIYKTNSDTAPTNDTISSDTHPENVINSSDI